MNAHPNTPGGSQNLREVGGKDRAVPKIFTGASFRREPFFCKPFFGNQSQLPESIQKLGAWSELQYDIVDSRFVLGLSRSKIVNTRIEAVLGSDGRRRLAAALQCTRQRFNYEPARSSICAILELLELAKERRISEGDLPRRFRDPGESLPVSQPKERFAKLLGNKALEPRLAAVLNMSQAAIAQAFNGRSARSLSDLAAILELLEILHDPTAAEKSWPERWWNINTVQELRRSTRRLPGPTIDPLQIKARIAHVLGGANPSARFARALDKSPDSLTRIWRSEVDSQGRVAKVQPTLVAVIELLETLQREGIPVERWPERWRVSNQGPVRPGKQMTPSALSCAISAKG